MSCYLSIDLDYFIYKEKLPTKLFKDILTSDIPKTITETHDGLITSIEKNIKQIEEVVNMDFHSDLASFDPKGMPLEKNEGTWANFIKNSHSKRFIWSPPLAKTKLSYKNYCHGDTYINPFIVNTMDFTGWKDVSIKPRYFPLLKNCVAVGISISPGWTPDRLINQFAKLYRKYANCVYVRRSAKTYLT